jgi:aryl-alcohol dehydrogenase-like predicted oxidoreductase
LTGKYNQGIPADSRANLKGYEWTHERITNPDNLSKVRALEPIAQGLDCTLSQLAIAWCLKNPFVSTVITGASRVEQVNENMKASDIASRITPEMLERIDQIFGILKEEEED